MSKMFLVAIILTQFFIYGCVSSANKSKVTSAAAAKSARSPSGADGASPSSLSLDQLEAKKLLVQKCQSLGRSGRVEDERICTVAVSSTCTFRKQAVELCIELDIIDNQAFGPCLDAIASKAYVDLELPRCENLMKDIANQGSKAVVECLGPSAPPGTCKQP
jgi:hypothetical protein